MSKVKGKAIKTIGALSSIAGSTWGGNLLALRRIFKAVIIPQITYGASIWYTLSDEKGHCKALVMQLAQVQALGARLITGAFKATSTQALNIEAHLIPIGLELDKKTNQTAARLYSGPLYPIITQDRSTHLRRTFTPLEILEKRHTKLLGSNIQELEKKPAYIVAPWWQPPSVNIPSSKEKAINQHNQYLAQKTVLETLAYTDGSGINNKIGSECIILGKDVAIKKFLRTDKTSTVYMGEMQGIQDSLTYAINEQQTSIRVFTDNQAALQALKDPDKCSTPQIMQTTTLQLDTLRTQGKSVSFHWIPSHKDIEGNENADIAAKEATGWRRAKRRNGKWKEWDSGYTAEKQKFGRSQATIKLALEQNTLEQWETAWAREKTGGELRTICPKPTKKILKIHKGLRKAVSALIVQMRTEKVGLRKFLHSRKVPGFDSPECPCRRGMQSAKHLLIECRMHVEKRNRTWEKDRRRAAFGRIGWEEMLTRPEFAKKAAQFMKSLGLIDQFRSANFD